MRIIMLIVGALMVAFGVYHHQVWSTPFWVIGLFIEGFVIYSTKSK